MAIKKILVSLKQLQPFNKRKQEFEKKIIFGPVFIYIFIMIRSNSGKHKQWKSMSEAQFVDFKRTGRGDSSQSGGWREKRTFYIPLFDAIKQRNKLPTTVNIIFSSR